ncbi:hypothetical protein ACFL5F_04300 [Planctomycetota bacterium]
MKGYYEEFHALGWRKNKANFGANNGFVIPVKYVLSCGKTIPKACGFEAATQ